MRAPSWGVESPLNDFQVFCRRFSPDSVLTQPLGRAESHFWTLLETI